MAWIVLLAVVLLAYANGSNDNFKGVATLYGSGAASFRTALGWATLTTLAGSLLALALAAGLVKTFSAKGLVPDAVASSSGFLAAVALGAMATVLIATRYGLPISTTHALTGALVGAGFVAVGPAVDLKVLGTSFFIPLLVSPMLAVAMTMFLYPIASRLRRLAGISRVEVAGSHGEGAMRYEGTLFGVSVHRSVEALHFLSAGAVSFARGLNDTPKIFALLLAAKAVGTHVGVGVVGAAMALGGLLNSRRVAETMAHKITKLELGQGLIANLTTASLVIGASRLGVPVSTTHVSTGGLFGIGVLTGKANVRTIVAILGAWGITLPLGAMLGALALRALRLF